jgi:hypothetical protein
MWSGSRTISEDNGGAWLYPGSAKEVGIQNGAKSWRIEGPHFTTEGKFSTITVSFRKRGSVKNAYVRYSDPLSGKSRRILLEF